MKQEPQIHWQHCDYYYNYKILGFRYKLLPHSTMPEFKPLEHRATVVSLDATPVLLNYTHNNKFTYHQTASVSESGLNLHTYKIAKNS